MSDTMVPGGKPVPGQAPVKAQPVAQQVRPPQARPAGAPVARAIPQAQPQMQAVAAQAVPEDEEGEETAEAPRSYHFLLFNAMPSWMISAIIHAILLVIMAIWTVSENIKEIQQIVAENFGDAEEIEEFKDELMPTPVDVMTDATSTTTDAVASAVEVPTEVVDVSVSNDVEAAPVAIELSTIGEKTAPRNDLTKTIGAVSGSGVDGRGAASQAAMVAAAGGSAGSQAAVAAALRWFAEHQMPDGGWNFDHRLGACQGRCSEAGKMTTARNGATGLALLPFLGSGQTHKEGAYKEHVKRGLYYLVQHMKPDHGGGSLVDGGNMYSHGICSIVLCEAYAMTHDRELMAPAQAAINFIVYAQDPVGGGWRYSPRQPGDTSAVGWQLMALKSGHMAYLNVPPATVAGAVKFLDSVQADSGSQYGYTGPGAGQATTAVGLLSRMYLGWKKDNPALQRGVEAMSRSGVSKGNMYYNYYATQIMRHVEGDAWKKWNDGMRDWLVESQAKNGHEKGSWFMKGGDHGADSGGRLYCTSIATMMLEVYYRHMPIYGKQASEDDFPL